MKLQLTPNANQVSASEQTMAKANDVLNAYKQLENALLALQMTSTSDATRKSCADSTSSMYVWKNDIVRQLSKEGITEA